MSSSSSTLLGIIDNQNQCHQSNLLALSSVFHRQLQHFSISLAIFIVSVVSVIINFTRSQFSVITSKTFQNIQLLVSLELLDGEGVESLVYFWREVPFEDSVVCLRTQSFHEGGALVAGYDLQETGLVRFSYRISGKKVEFSSVSSHVPCPMSTEFSD